MHHVVATKPNREHTPSSTTVGYIASMYPAGLLVQLGQIPFFPEHECYTLRVCSARLRIHDLYKSFNLRNSVLSQRWTWFGFIHGLVWVELGKIFLPQLTQETSTAVSQQLDNDSRELHMFPVSDITSLRHRIIIGRGLGWLDQSNFDT